MVFLYLLYSWKNVTGIAQVYSIFPFQTGGVFKWSVSIPIATTVLV